MLKNSIDKQGRIYLPKKFRLKLDWEPEDALLFSVDEKSGTLMIQKKSNSCLCCNGKKGLIHLKSGIYLCRTCAKKRLK